MFYSKYSFHNKYRMTAGIIMDTWKIRRQLDNLTLRNMSPQILPTLHTLASYY